MANPKQWPGAWPHGVFFFSVTALGFAIALLGCLFASIPLAIAVVASFLFGSVFGLLAIALRRKSVVGKQWVPPLLVLIGLSLMIYFSRRLPEVEGIEKSLSQELSAVPQIPGSKLSRHLVRTWRETALVQDRFTDIPTYDEVKSFYLEEMRKDGWRLKAEQRFLKDNHLLVFCKGPLKAEVFYDAEIHQELKITFMGSINADYPGESYVFC